MQVIIDDYMRSEAVLKESRMLDELDLDGGRLPSLRIQHSWLQQCCAPVLELTCV